MIKLSSEVRSILNDPELLALRDRKMAEFSAFFEDPDHPHTKETIPVLRGDCGMHSNPYACGGRYPEMGDPLAWLEASLPRVAERAEQIRDDKVFRPVCLQNDAYGVHFIDKLLGADVFFQDGQIYNHYLKNPVGQLQEPDLDRDPVWQFLRRAAEAFVEADVKLPLFGLPCIASPLNIAVNLYSEEFLIAMLEDPDAAKHDLEVITNLQVRIHTFYRDLIPAEQLQCVVAGHRTQPPGCGQLCGCTTHLISGELYEEFVMPCDEAILSVYPNPGLIHLCGKHSQHIPVFRKMKCLHAVQVNDAAAEELELYFKGLRSDQVIYLSRSPGMPVDRAMEITDGRRMILSMPDRPQ